MLHIYKASAGAGKTHHLTGEYIKLLFGKQYAFRHILAVTFTNKATDEMKQRILLELYNLSDEGKDSPYLEEIMKFTGKQEKWVRERAREILVSILHDYTSFRVTTIDKFFQQVMRSFAKELGRMATYNVEMDDEGVLEKAVDRMYSDLDDPQQHKLLQWLIEYSLDAVEKGVSWDVKSEIKGLAKQLFNENFKLAKERSGDAMDTLSLEGVWDFKGVLKNRIKEFEKDLKGLCSQALKCIAEHGLEIEDFRNKAKGPFSYFGKVVKGKGGKEIPYPTNTFLQLYGNIDNWYSGKKCPAAIEGVYGELNEIIGKITALLDDGYSGYLSAIAVSEKVNVFGILNDIYARLVEYCREKNIILLSESTELLGRIIDGSDTPFVYEKIGARLDNFMLDEFQDTSLFQWRNFYPLLQNSMAMGNDNLIVGDVKQSIYRWRGSDWKILSGGLRQQFRSDEIEEGSLVGNFRSGEEIVQFNNDFFRFCASCAQDIYGRAEDGEMGTIEKIYSDVEQKIPATRMGKKGYVEVEFVSAEENLMERALEILPNKVEDLLSRGYRQRDIAVLVRKNTEGKAVADKLLECGYEIISGDSLHIASSPQVRKVVSILRGLENPSSRRVEALGILNRMPEVADASDLSGGSLYQLCENIIRGELTVEERGDTAFLQAFLDIVLDFTVNNGTNLSQFIKWWDENGVKKTISAPEDTDAITIMTIHKSKGLAFDVVIVPFLKEELDGGSNDNILWCSYDGLPVPVTYKKMLSGTDFCGEYLDEMLYKYIDGINTVYVAFTRPRKELLVIAQEPRQSKGKGDVAASISGILYGYFNLHKEKCGWDDKIVLGEKGISDKDEGENCGMALSDTFRYPVDKSRLKTVSQGGTIGEGESIREHGIAMHYVFSLVDYPGSIPAAVKRAVAEGAASCSEAELLEMVNRKVASVAQYGWFDEGYTVMNECSILTPYGEEKRPDRVLIKEGEAIVVDYKFGAYSEEDTLQIGQYKKQVSRYKDLLTAMGYTNVQGWLWYLSADVVISV